MQDLLFIKGNIPSSKNSKINTSKGSFMSKTVKKFLSSYGIQKYSVREKTVTGYKRRPNLFMQYGKYFQSNVPDTLPIQIGFHFVRGTKHKADFHNLVQLLADMFVAHEFIPEDDMDNFLPFPLKLNNTWYSYDKENPGVYIKIFQNDNT